jgi:hypothetical protein
MPTCSRIRAIRGGDSNWGRIVKRVCRATDIKAVTYGVLAEDKECTQIQYLHFSAGNVKASSVTLPAILGEHVAGDGSADRVNILRLDVRCTYTISSEGLRSSKLATQHRHKQLHSRQVCGCRKDETVNKQFKE